MAVDLKKKSDGVSATYIRSKRTRVFKMKQDEFSEKFGVSIGTLRNWEQGVTEPPLYFIKLLELEENNLNNTYVAISENNILDKSLFVKSDIEQATKRIAQDKYQSAIYDIVMNMSKDGGIIDNLTKIKPCAEGYSVSDVAVISQLMLLQNIDDKLDELIKILSK